MKATAYPRISRWLMVAPALFLLTFLVIPTITLLSRSGELHSFTRLVSSSAFQHIVWFTVTQTAISTVLTVICALPITYVLSRFTFSGKRLLLALITAPFLLPTVVVGTALFALLPKSIHYTAVAIIIAHVFFNIAVVVRLVMPRWSQIDHELIHAAHTLGASTVRTFRTVTFPLIRPALGYASSAVALLCFTSFGVIRVLGGPAFSTLETEIYVRAVLLGDVQSAVTISVVQALILISAFSLWSRWNQQQPHAQTVSFSAPPPSSTQQRLIIALTYTATLFIVLAPLVALAWRSASGWSDLLTAEIGRSLYVSTYVAAIAALIATLLGAMLALSAAYARRASRFLESFASLPLMLSAVTVGLGILITFDHSPVEFRSAWWITPVAHALIAIPLVVRIVLPVALAIPQDLRDAAATLSADPGRQWLTIDFPLLSRALGTAFALSAAVSLGEFGATSFLTRRTSETLPVSIARLLSRPGDTQHAKAFALSTLFFVFSIGAVYIAETLRSRRNRIS